MRAWLTLACVADVQRGERGKLNPSAKRDRLDLGGNLPDPSDRASRSNLNPAPPSPSYADHAGEINVVKGRYS